MLPLELDGRQHPVSHMLALRVIEHFDVGEHILSCLGAGFAGSAPYPFPLEQVEGALRHGVVAGLAGPRLEVTRSFTQLFL